MDAVPEYGEPAAGYWIPTLRHDPPQALQCLTVRAHHMLCNVTSDKELAKENKDRICSGRESDSAQCYAGTAQSVFMEGALFCCFEVGELKFRTSSNFLLVFFSEKNQFSEHTA